MVRRELTRPLARRLALAGWLLLVAGQLACKGQDASQEATGKVTQAARADSLAVGIAIGSYAHAVAWIARDRGHLDAQRIQGRVVVTGGSAAATRALIARGIDVALAGGDAVLKANAAGADLVVIGSLVNRFYHRLVVLQEIQSAEQLRGQTIGLPFLGGPQDMAVRYSLKQLGLRYNEDVKVLSLGKEMNRMAALRRGDIQGTTSQTPGKRLKELGLRVLLDLPARPVAFPYMVVAVRRADLKRRRGLFVRFLRSLCAAIRDYRQPAKAGKHLAVIARHLSNADTAGAARERYRTGGPTLLSLPPTPDPAAFATVLRLLQRPELSQHLDGLLDASVLAAASEGGACRPTAEAR